MPSLVTQPRGDLSVSIAVGEAIQTWKIRRNFVNGSCIGSVFINDQSRRQALSIRLTTRVARTRRGKVHGLINDGNKIPSARQSRYLSIIRTRGLSSFRTRLVDGNDNRARACVYKHRHHLRDVKRSTRVVPSFQDTDELVEAISS